MTLVLASVESFLGSLWFAGLAFCLGFLASHFSLIPTFFKALRRK